MPRCLEKAKRQTLLRPIELEADEHAHKIHFHFHLLIFTIPYFA